MILKEKRQKTKERIQLAIQSELEALGFRHLKSMADYRRIIDNKTTIYLGYYEDCFLRNLIEVNINPSANYRDVEEVQYMLMGYTVVRNGHFRLGSRLQWLIPEGDNAYEDFCFRDSDSDEVINGKLEKLLWRIRTYVIPYLEKLADKDRAIVEITKLDRRGLIHFEGVVPIMHCLWKHDKKAALDYLEEKRLRLLEWVEPWEWELMERFKKGERFGDKKPVHAMNYENYMDFVAKFREWLNHQ